MNWALGSENLLGWLGIEGCAVSSPFHHNQLAFLHESTSVTSHRKIPHLDSSLPVPRGPLSTHLLLLAVLSVGLGLGSLLPGTDVSGLGSGVSQLAVSTTLHLLGQVVLLDFRDAVLDADARVDGQNS